MSTQVGTGAPRQEVEVKYQVLDTAAVLSTLAARGVELSAPFGQDDQAYAPVGWDYGQSKIDVPFARLRTEGAVHLFTVKKPLTNDMACLECQSEVSDRDQMHEALLAMGFRPTVRILKTRRTGMFGDISVCLDEVRGAGTFLEAERIIDADQSGEAAQRHLDQRIQSWDMPLRRAVDTYDSLIRAALLDR